MPLALARSDPPTDALAARELIDAYVAYLAQTGRQSDTRYDRTAERFFTHWPNPMAWAAEPLRVRRRARGRVRTLLMFLMLHRHLRPGYDYLLDITLLPLWRELPASPLHADLEQFRVASRELGFTAPVSKGAAGLVAARLLIQTGRRLAALTDEDIAAFDAALRERQVRTGRGTGHYGRRCSLRGRCSTTSASCRGRRRTAPGPRHKLRAAPGTLGRHRPDPPDVRRLSRAATRDAGTRDSLGPSDGAGVLRRPSRQGRSRSGQRR